MIEIHDSQGRAWRLELNVAAARALRDAAGIDLGALDAGTPTLLTRLAADPVTIFDALAELTRAQRAETGVTVEQFEASFEGEHLAEAVAGLWGEVLGFFRHWNPPTARRIHKATFGTVAPNLPTTPPTQTGPTPPTEATPSTPTPLPETGTGLGSSGASSPSAPGSAGSTPSA